MNRKQRRALKAQKVKMPEATKEAIQQEYFQLCAQAGELQYKIAEFSSQLVQLNGKIAELNRSYSEKLSAEPKEAVKEEGGFDAHQVSPGPV